MNGKLRLFSILLSLNLFTAGVAMAQVPQNITCVNQFYHGWQDGVYDVAMQGNFAYLACGDEGMRIVDISNPAEPLKIGLLAHGFANVVAAAENYAYLGITDDGVCVIDISSKSNPQEVAFISLHGAKEAIRISGNHIFICYSGGMTIVDVTNPLNPLMVWTYDADQVTDVEIHGDLAYVAANFHGLVVLDISQITSPQILGSYVIDDGDWVKSASISGNYAFLACGWDGLQVIDLSTMQMIADIDSLAYAFRIKVRDNLAYMTYGDPECPLAIVDISTPESPQIAGIYYPPEDIVNFALSGELCYVAAFQHGLRMVDLSTPQLPHEEYVYNLVGQDAGIIVLDDYAIVKQEFKIVSVDISDYSGPQELGYWESTSSILDMQVSGDIAYTCNFSNTCLYAIDVSDRSAPTFIGSYTAEHDVHYDLGIYDHYAYLTENDGLRIVDLADPAAMYQAGFYSLPYPTRIATIFDHYAVLTAADSRLIILDLSDPLSPQNLGNYSTGEYCQAAKVRGNLLFLLTQHFLLIYGVGNPQQLQFVSSTRIIEGGDYSYRGLDVAGNSVYLAIDGTGIFVYDVSDLVHPRPAGYSTTPGSPRGICADGNFALVADMTNLGFYDCSAAVSVDDPGNPIMPGSFALLPSYPNPFNASTRIQFELPVSGRVTITIFDVLGRNVATLADRIYPAGQHSILWDSASSNTGAISSGVYFVQAKAGNEMHRLPVTLLK